MTYLAPTPDTPALAPWAEHTTYSLPGVVIASSWRDSSGTYGMVLTDTGRIRVIGDSYAGEGYVQAERLDIPADILTREFQEWSLSESVAGIDAADLAGVTLAPGYMWIIRHCDGALRAYYVAHDPGQSLARVTHSLTVNSVGGVSTVTRTGTLTGEISPAGMVRVMWDQDGFGRAGWLTPGEFSRA